MNAFVAPTDRTWFDFLSEKAARGEVDEVNFWLPKPWGGRFGVLSPGQPLLFKLKSPWNAVAGGGFFSHYTELPISLAWQAFGPKNGAPSLMDVRDRIARLRRETPAPWEDYTIGCILLAEPFFWPEEDWIPGPPGWKGQIVRGRTYDLTVEPGQTLWSQVCDRLEGMRGVGIPPGEESPPPFPSQSELFGGMGAPTLTPRRIGQGIFSSIIRDAYGRACAISGERALPALDAAHIRPFEEVQGHSIRNGILLRSDMHRLFDAGYLTITPKHRVEASGTMRDDFNDGDNYLRLHGTRVAVPEREELTPDPEMLRWHNENRFRG
ncbi:MAG: HNH endonuclease [Gemmatimonadota bacterium]